MFYVLLSFAAVSVFVFLICFVSSLLLVIINIPRCMISFYIGLYCRIQIGFDMCFAVKT